MSYSLVGKGLRWTRSLFLGGLPGDARCFPSFVDLRNNSAPCPCFVESIGPLNITMSLSSTLTGVW